MSANFAGTALAENAGDSRNMKNRAAIYIRLSKEEKIQNQGSLQIQQEMLRHYVEKKGFLLTGVYCDDGQSGVDFAGVR